MNKEILQKLVPQCYSFNEVLTKLHKNVSSKTYKLLKDKLDEFEINYSHFNESENKVHKKYELEEILVENSSYPSNKLKERLINAGILNNVCTECGISNIWNNKPLILQLDHINGNHYDNRIDNLRLLCPNCHSQTSTFSRIKNINASIKLCIECGCEISKTSVRCKKCSAKKNNKVKVNWPSKDIIEKAILNGESFVSIASKYNATDNALRKYCKRIGLPSTKQEVKEYLNSL